MLDLADLGRGPLPIDALLYLRQEGRGIGLAAKLDAYRLQDRGLDTFAANQALSLPADARDYACGAAMLRAMGVDRIRLISDNPDKAAQLARHGIEVVECLPTGTFLTPHNRDYLRAKAEISGHRLQL
jgi:GTP cyclohydrolase II